MFLQIHGGKENSFMNQAIIPTIVVVLVIYFAAMVFIGWMGRSKASNFEGYLSMGRTGGVLLLMGGAIGGQIGNGFVVGGAAEGAESAFPQGGSPGRRRGGGAFRVTSSFGTLRQRRLKCGKYIKTKRKQSEKGSGKKLKTR